MSHRAKTYALVVGLLAAFAAQAILGMSRESATSDEVPHLTAGYSYLKTGDYRLNYEHPPLVKLIAAVPLLALNLNFNEEHPSWRRGDEWAFGEEFINNNRVSAKRIIFWGRLPMVGLALLAGFVVFRWSSEIHGPRAGILSLFLYAFCPNMLANAPLVTLDVGNALFTMLSIYTLYRLLIDPGPKQVLFAGCALGLAFATKVTAFSLLPIYLLLAAVFFKRRETPGLNGRRALESVALLVLPAAVILLATYRVTAISSYFGALKYFVEDVGKGGRPAFLFGHYSLHGWWYYFLAAILVKTPIPLLALAAVAFAGLVRWRKTASAEYCLVIPIIYFLVVASLGRLQLGLRYVLQIYPLAYIYVGGRMSLLADSLGEAISKSRPRLARAWLILPGVLLVWYAAGTLKVFPNYIAYFNELVGGPKNGYKYLLDSNVDWGQDLPALARFLESKGKPEVILSFFGTASPRTYDITYQDFYSYNLSGRREDHINSLTPEREVFVISANSLQCLYYPDKHAYDWLKERHPMGRPGYSLFVYDITNDSDAHMHLGAMYLGGNHLKKAEREFDRALVIDPTNSAAKQQLDDVRQRLGQAGPPG